MRDTKCWLALAATLLCGCKLTTVSRAFPDGSRVTVTDQRCLVGTKATLSITWSSNGVSHLTLSSQSSPHTESVEALGRGLGEGLRNAPK